MDNDETFLKIMGRDVYARHTGITVLEAKPGYARTRLAVGPETLNGHGNLHGGALFTLADYTAAIAANMHGDATMAVNGSIQYLRAVRGGEVFCIAQTVKTGKRMKFMQADITDEDGVLVAIFQGGALAVTRNG